MSKSKDDFELVRGSGNVFRDFGRPDADVLDHKLGIRQMVRLGMNVVLVRDLTDAMYDPRDEPYVSHRRGAELVIEHIERYWGPSIVSTDLVHLRGAETQDPSTSSGA